MAQVPVHKRVLLKLSGEILGGEKGMGIEASIINALVSQIKEVNELGVEVGVDAHLRLVGTERRDQHRVDLRGELAGVALLGLELCGGADTAGAAARARPEHGAGLVGDGHGVGLEALHRG